MSTDRDDILSIYDAAVEPKTWPLVLDRIAEGIGARGAIVFEWSSQDASRVLSATHASSFFDPVQLATYIERCQVFEAADQDIFEAHSLQSDGINLIDDSVLAPSVAALKERKNVQILEKFGILHRAAGLLNKDNPLQARFSVQLGSDRGPLTEQNRSYLGRVLPHVAKALDLGRPATQLALENQGLIAAMDRLLIGVCVLDAQGRVVTMNTEFRRQLERYATFDLPPGGVLRLSQPADQRRFEHLKSDCLHHGQFGARPRKEAVATDEEAVLCIELVPCTQNAEIGAKAFGGFILNSVDTSLPVHCATPAIQQAYGLTDAELALVDAIAAGKTNVQIAEERDRAVATINTQVKSILSKTRCASRTQLVRLMMSFAGRYVEN